ncbi:CocE/NonD family hydrolase [Nocardia rhizosphaerihabitans]|uniref:CocE/NonD family hydrolase n=1 Tax=Nocardia rhizosphaerihabitans TaxID=1691570 RepID=UPI00366C1B13
MQNWAGWFDAGTAQGAVRRFVRQSNPMNVIIGPWGHGGEVHLDPLRSPDEAIPPAMTAQDANDFRFADACLTGQIASEKGKVLHYYTLGEGWKSTHMWPVPATRRTWYMASGRRLATSPDEVGFDSLEVDRSLGDTASKRWAQNGDLEFGGDRRQFDAARLAYTSEPLTGDLEITGHPVIHLNISSTREDGGFFAYLEGVRPDEVSYYLTEGQLRASHRKVWPDSPFSSFGPQQRHFRADAEPLTPGVPTAMSFTMHPISARLPAGHRLRVVVAGSDYPTFTNVPVDGTPPNLQFHRGPGGCKIDLPIIEP